ncbi:PAS domain S-box protein [bacterium]|nr:PAS domain S-box protein [bacterium]PIV81720.1 MAG: hypothetical protein COW53_02830 [bacterium CG17_big_fil_post_rev_8_21_14_2_50_64_8]PJA76708.1 MAG: hypothetical protein CO151_02000 [bacterium CG_4_9_14_3_um_filter_65_15]
MPTTVSGIDLFPTAREGSIAREALWWRLLSEQSRDGIVVLDHRGKVFWTNEKFPAMLGRTREETLGLSVPDWEADIPPDTIEEMLEQVDASGAHFETIHRRKDGSTYEVEICSNAVTINQEKLASLGQLAAGVAHEINNPLAFILSNFVSLTEYMDDLACFVAEAKSLIELPHDSDPEDVNAAVASLRNLYKTRDIGFAAEDAPKLVFENIEGVERIRNIVANLKGFARPDEKRPTPSSVRKMIEVAMTVAHNELKYRCEVVVELDDDLPPLCCFRQQIEQVLMNLMVNASHAMKKSGTIRIGAAVEGDREMRITIEDDGSGIAPENFSRIFDPFFTTKEIGRGTGLGLHIVRSIIESHGGRVAVESRVGSGTTFTISCWKWCTSGLGSFPAMKSPSCRPSPRWPPRATW